MTTLLKSTTPRRRWIIGGSLGLAVVIAGISTAAFIAAGQPSSPTASPAPTQPATDVADRPNPPQTVSVAASFPGWDVAPEHAAGVSAESGLDFDGVVNLRITSAGAATGIITQTIGVAPNTEYSVSAAYGGDGAGVAVRAGLAEPRALDPAASTTEWSETVWSYTTAADETSMLISVDALAPLNGARLDGLTVRAMSDQTNLLQNGSFDEYSAPTQVTNDTLIMQTGAAYVGVSARVGEVSWDVVDDTGAPVSTGTIENASGLGLIQLGELEQGFYTINLASAEPGLPRDSFAFMVLDEPVSEVRDDRFGAHIHVQRPYYLGAEEVAQQLGLTHTRTDAYWSHTEHEKGVYEFPAEIDPIYEAYAARGITVLPISIYGNPNYDGGLTASSPEGIEAYSKYTSAVVGHYGVEAIEVYNEYNHEPFNNSACGRTAACYMQLLVPTAERIRSEHPGTLILGPATAHKDDKFLTELYQLGGLDYLDAITFHPYDYDYDQNKGAEFLVESLKQAQDRIKEHNNGQEKPIWLSEMGWTSTLVESDQQQADYLVRSEVIALASNVVRFYWYDLVNDHLNPADHQGSYGMVRQKTPELPVFEPKHSASAQAILTRKIGGKAFSSRDELNATTYSYAFGEGDDTTRVAWATKPVSVKYATTTPVTITDQYGRVSVLEPVKGGVTIELGEQTVYLDGDLGEVTVTK